MLTVHVEKTLQLLPNLEVDPLALTDEDVKHLVIQIATHLRTPGTKSDLAVNALKAMPALLQEQVNHIVTVRGLDKTDPLYLFWLRPASVNIALGINYATLSQEDTYENV